MNDKQADVAVLIDATLSAAEREVARELALGAARCARRTALLVFGDHADCARGPRRPRVDYDVEGSPFFEDPEKINPWLEAKLQPIQHAYLDSALECALAAAADLPWRPESPKLALLMGGSLPHNSSASRLPLRTGIDCTRGRCWRDELERLTGLGVVTHAATPSAPEPRDDDFASLLILEVWTILNGGRRPSVIEPGLPARWAELISRSHRART